ncbi:CPBP family intramembrane metalloprotease [Stakelama sp. CBK3Z-3]|uniref:CPBP family intramembrane metalloprotease n=1 Tax=Stakelama flava TaxID=2860338 RepID=A0ABS6XM15_9SPHN|nr:CPBP family intramembrane glutamic endopeptidase [Stakelama flava]MBW4331225.1 CPBP family intramembrane metalloprotease [Stakelama flava]
MTRSPVLDWLLLFAALGCYWLFLKGRLADRFGVSARGRRALYRFWVVKSAVLFIAPALVILAILGRGEALFAMPDIFAVAAGTLGLVPGGLARDTAFLLTVAGGLFGGALLGALMAQWRRRRGRAPWMMGNLRAVLPGKRGDLPAAAAVALAAGVSEELFFRLLLPLLIALVSGSALLGFVLSALLFVLAHRYQGAIGMIGSTALALVFTGFYWMTGSLWMTMLLHAAVDLNGLVIRPFVLGIRA